MVNAGYVFSRCFYNEHIKYACWPFVYFIELLLAILMQIAYNNNPDSYWIEVEKFSQTQETIFLFLNIAGLSLTSIYALRSFYVKRENLRKNTEFLLENVLPKEVISYLSAEGAKEKRAVKQHKNVVVVFIDLVDFSSLSKKLGSIDLVNLLNNIFFDFDQLAEKYQMEKIKTIEDGYMAVSGIQNKTPDQYMRLSIQFCLAIIEHAKTNPLFLSHNIKVRVGADAGEVVSGISLALSV